jgi:hypothetical protein
MDFPFYGCHLPMSIRYSDHLFEAQVWTLRQRTSIAAGKDGSAGERRLTRNLRAGMRILERFSM